MNWADIALRFGPAEYVAFLVLLLMLVSAAAPQPLARSVGMGVMGLLLGTLGDDTFGEPRNVLSLPLTPEDLTVLVTCVALFALLVPQIAQHMQGSQEPQRQHGTEARGATLWETVYHCLGFWPASGAFIAATGWARRPAWTGPFATAWCGVLLAWYGLPPELFGVCAVVAVAGLVFLQLGCPCVPLLAGMLASPVLEQNLQRSLLLSRGEWGPLVLQRPLVAAMLVLGLLAIGARAHLQRRHAQSWKR